MNGQLLEKNDVDRENKYSDENNEKDERVIPYKVSRRLRVKTK